MMRCVFIAKMVIMADTVDIASNIIKFLMVNISIRLMVSDKAAMQMNDSENATIDMTTSMQAITHDCM